MVKCVRDFCKDEGGTTAIEYGLIAAGISVVIVAATISIGQKVLGLFQTIETGL